MVTGRRRFSGTLPLHAMPRLRDSLAGEGGAARYEIEFGRDEFGVPFLALRVEARLPLTCQRTLEPFELPVDLLDPRAVAEPVSRLGQIGQFVQYAFDLVDGLPFAVAVADGEFRRLIPQQLGAIRGQRGSDPLPTFGKPAADRFSLGLLGRTAPGFS